MPEKAPHYHDPAPAPVDPGRAALPIAASPLLFGLPRPALFLVSGLATVALAATATIVAIPFDGAAFGGLTVPTVLVSGIADGLNPCSFALLVLFATYTLTLVNAVNRPTAVRPSRRGAGSWAPAPSTSARSSSRTSSSVSGC